MMFIDNKTTVYSCPGRTKGCSRIGNKSELSVRLRSAENGIIGTTDFR